MQIEATDDDEAGINSEIVYSIISQEPAGAGHMFRIDEKTGKLYVKEPTLNREVRLLHAKVALHMLLLGCANQMVGYSVGHKPFHLYLHYYFRFYIRQTEKTKYGQIIISKDILRGN